MPYPYLTRQDLTIVQGDSMDIELNVVDLADAPLDLTGWTSAGFVGSRTDPQVFSLTTDDTDVAVGKILAAFDSADTDDLIPGEAYTYQVRITNGSGDVKTILRGTLNVIDSLFVI